MNVNGLGPTERAAYRLGYVDALRLEEWSGRFGSDGQRYERAHERCPEPSAMREVASCTFPETIYRVNNGVIERRHHRDTTWQPSTAYQIDKGYLTMCCAHHPAEVAQICDLMQRPLVTP